MADPTPTAYTTLYQLQIMPLRCVGAVSARYMGTAQENIPEIKPRMILAAMKSRVIPEKYAATMIRAGIDISRRLIITTIVWSYLSMKDPETKMIEVKGFNFEPEC